MPGIITIEESVARRSASDVNLFDTPRINATAHWRRSDVVLNNTCAPDCCLRRRAKNPKKAAFQRKLSPPASSGSGVYLLPLRNGIEFNQAGIY